eukprot:scaffold170267_cov16-Tisochrysis_lutea.AAC.1
MARALRKSSYLKAPSLVQLGFPSSLVAARGMVGDGSRHERHSQLPFPSSFCGTRAHVRMDLSPK